MMWIVGTAVTSRGVGIPSISWKRWWIIGLICILHSTGALGAENDSPSWEERAEVVRDLLITEWGWLDEESQAELDSWRAALRNHPQWYAPVVYSMLGVIDEDDIRQAEEETVFPLTNPMEKQLKLIEIAKLLGPEHGAQVLREFEAVLRTRIEDQGWVAIVAYKQGVSAEEIKDRKLGVHPALPRLHGAVIDALAELGDTSLVRYVARALAGDARGGSGGRAYLLRAVRAGDAEARRCLEYLLENHPNAFPNGSDACPGSSAAIHEWGRKAREALAAGEAAGRSEGEASSAGSDADEGDEGEAGAAP